MVVLPRVLNIDQQLIELATLWVYIVFPMKKSYGDCVMMHMNSPVRFVS